jgi:uncharacterized repeat protein (TIGR01451 family)
MEQMLRILFIIILWVLNIDTLMAQNINIPNIKFKNALLYSVCADTTGDDIPDSNVDFNEDNEIQLTEALLIKGLNLNNKQITSLVGIEEFQNLKWLFCDKNFLGILNLQSNTSLELLTCTQSSLNSLILDGLTNLKQIGCTNNQLTQLNIQSLASLEGLWCQGNQLTSLDAQGLLNLKLLTCSLNPLTSLHVEGLANLIALDCSNSNLTNVNFTGLTNLVELNFDKGNITSFELQGLFNLKKLSCNDLGPMNTIIIKNLPNLETLSCGGNYDNYHLLLDSLPNLRNLQCAWNKLTELNLSGLDSLRVLNCEFNYIHQLDVLHLKKLQILNCGNNSFGTLNVSNLPELQKLDCSWSNIDTLILVGTNNLKHLVCFINNLKKIEIGHLKNLEEFNASKNQFTEIDVSQLNKLKSISLGDNQLTTLNVVNCVDLTYLDCYRNNLKSLFIKNGKKEVLLFEDNPLEYICCDDIQMVNVNNLLEAYEMNCEANSYCNFVSGGSFYLINGQSNFDINLNGCDSNAVSYPNLKYQISSDSLNGSFIADESGYYDFPLQSGNHILKPILENSAYYSVSPDSILINLPLDSNALVHNFCIKPIGILNDLVISLIPLQVARPGFEVKYQIGVTNKGNQSNSGTITLVFDDNLMDFISSSMSPDVLITDTLRWNFSNLIPFESKKIDILFQVNSPMSNPSVNVGDVLTIKGFIQNNADENLLIGNDFVMNQTVVGSYDPNDKTCLEGTYIRESQIGNYLHYLIRFENTGNFAAENIIVHDIIDTSKFEINSLQITHTSHNCLTRILNVNQVAFIFENINLPFTEPDKHGFVTFKIKTKTSLLLGDNLTNKADIFFDYNFPVRTNPAITTVLETIDTKSLQNSLSNITLSPNPATEKLEIFSEVPFDKLEIYDGLSRNLKVIYGYQTAIDISNLSNGIYFLKISGANGFLIKQFVKE